MPGVRHELNNFGQAPRALLFANDGLGRDAAMLAVGAVGGEMAACLPLDALMERLDQQADAQAVLVELEGVPAPQLAPMLSRLSRFVDELDTRAVITASRGQIDEATAYAGSARIELMCEPDLADRITALSMVWTPQTPVFADGASEVDSLRLKRLADEVNRIARALANLSVTGDGMESDRLHPAPHPFQPAAVRDVQSLFMPEPASLDTPVLPPAAELRTILRLRRLRESFFDGELFADPAWDMMLDLLAARLEGDQVAVSSLCIAAAVPPTTALRWIKTMTDAGLLERHADPMDGRRIFIRLSDMAVEKMGQYFAAARRHGTRVI